MLMLMPFISASGLGGADKDQEINKNALGRIYAVLRKIEKENSN